MASKPLQLYYTEFPPFSLRHDNGEPGGILLDYLSYMFHVSDIDYVSKYYPPKRFFKTLEEGKIPIVTSLRNSIDDELYHVSKTPVLSFDLYLYWINGLEPKQELEQLADTNLAVIFGYNYNGLLSRINNSQNVEIKSLADAHSSLDMLKIGRVKYLLNYSAVMEYAYSERELQQLQRSHIATLNLHLVVRKDLTMAMDYMYKLENAYLMSQENGTVKNAFMKYTK